MTNRLIFNSEHSDFRESVRSFLAKEAIPNRDTWEEQGIVDRDFWHKAAAQGLVGFAVAPEYGGAGVSDFRFNAVLDEELAYARVPGDGFMMANDILAPYLMNLTNHEQRAAWLPNFTVGAWIGAIAMTEPGAGSDLRAIATTARLEDGAYVISGSKTFVTSGIQADLVIVVARTSGRLGEHDGLSLIAVHAGTPGYERGRKLEKVGRRAQDTAELFFNQTRVPAENLIGREGQGLELLKANLPQERLAMAVSGLAAAETAFAVTLEYCRARHAFGRPIGSHQAIRFSLAEMHTQLRIARVYIDDCIETHTRGALSPEDAASAKYWTTDLQCSVIDECLQLHGGYGYMEEYPIARMWRDARVQRIYGGTNEIMKDIVGRSLGV